jgi:hypothetical protein
MSKISQKGQGVYTWGSKHPNLITTSQKNKKGHRGRINIGPPQANFKRAVNKNAIKPKIT